MTGFLEIPYSVDVFLPDLKYYDSSLSGQYSGAPDYFAVASGAIEKMVELAGPPVLNDAGIMTGGVLVRHMVLPGARKDSMKLLDWLWSEFGDDIYLSLMSQYTPMYRAKEFPKLPRRLPSFEYESVREYAAGRDEVVYDLDFLQKFQEIFARAVGMTAVTVDADGKPITRPTDWSEFCMKYTRGTAEGCRRCEQCDKNGGETAARTGRPTLYECHAGLYDFGAPIIVDGKQIGSILGGQILTAPPDEDKFRAYAKEIGADPEKYVEAVRKIQIMQRDRR